MNATGPFSTSWMRRSVRLAGCALALGPCVLGPGAATAGAQTSEAATENVTLAPIECWMRTSSNAVRVGELFDLVLTCAVVETESTTVIPDESRLDPGALQVPPFEVVNGARASDLLTRTHRYFQYEYSLRFVGEQIGADVELPGPTINYRVQSRVQGSAALEGRDRQYQLPSARVRIVSLVPAPANDIRDPLPESFRAIEDRRFRASLLRIVSWAFFAIAAVVGAWALAALIRRPRTAGAASPRLAPEGAVLSAALRELAEVQRLRQAGGWSGELAARALTPLRVAASYVAGRQVAQIPATSTATAAPGQLRVTSGFPRRRTMLVSGAATTETLPASANANGLIEDLRSAMATLTAAAYGLDDAGPADSQLDDALELATSATRSLARGYTPAARAVKAVRQSAAVVRNRAWAR